LIKQLKKKYNALRDKQNNIHKPKFRLSRRIIKKRNIRTHSQILHLKKGFFYHYIRKFNKRLRFLQSRMINPNNRKFNKPKIQIKSFYFNQISHDNDARQHNQIRRNGNRTIILNNLMQNIQANKNLNLQHLFETYINN
jgi:hypothetical protein